MKRALVLSLICVLGLAFTGLAATLSGSWDTDVTIDLSETDFSAAIALASVLTVNYTVGDWTFTSITSLDDTGWADQDFNAVGVLGAFTIATALDLNPTNVPSYFGDLDVTIGVSIAGVVFGIDLNLYYDPAPGSGDVELDLTLSASGVAGDVTVEADIYFGTYDNDFCDLDWTGIDITIGYPFCCVAVESTIAFDCNGLDYVEFAIEGLIVPNLPWLTIDGSITFDLSDGKTVVLSPNLDFGVDVCFDLYWDLTAWDVAGNGFSISDITLDGIALTCDIGGVTFEGITYWGAPIGATPDFPGLLAGFSQQYFEAYKISTTDDACCGPFDFSFAVYFQENLVAQLFDVDLFIAEMSLEVASQFTFTMGLEVDATLGFTEWIVGFEVTW